MEHRKKKISGKLKSLFYLFIYFTNYTDYGLTLVGKSYKIFLILNRNVVILQYSVSFYYFLVQIAFLNYFITIQSHYDYLTLIHVILMKSLKSKFFIKICLS